MMTNELPLTKTALTPCNSKRRVM